MVRMALRCAVGRALYAVGRRIAGALFAAQSASGPTSRRLPCSPRKVGRRPSRGSRPFAAVKSLAVQGPVVEFMRL